MPLSCVICGEIFSKYKCSICYSSYCSLKCCKKHKKEDNCKAPEKINLLSRSDKKKYFTEDTVSEEKLTQLGESKTLKNILNNKYLQSTLIAIDNSSNPEAALKQAMKEPEFVEFVDECLKIVEDSHD